MRDGEGVVDATVAFRQRIDRRIALDQDQAGAGGVEKRHPALPHRLQMPAADDLGVEAGTAFDVADRDAEMHDGFDVDHGCLPR